MAPGLLLLRRLALRPQSARSLARRCHSTAASQLGPNASAPIAASNTPLCGTGPATATKPPPARTRFAPSPTGLLHLGSLRTALFNYLYAKHTGGQFLLRIEDTDQKRTLEGAEQAIYDTLRWAGLQWDEGPEVGGPFGPYRQSERAELHKEHAHILVKGGHAYRCFCSHERLATLAAQRARQNLPTDYDRTCTHISAAESEERAHKGETHVIRLKAPDDYPVFNDLLYGAIQYGSNKASHNLGSYSDPIILKSDGLPTYHLANVVDDHFMQITHVIRALEWMPSTPRHVFMYNCFGWAQPAFAHVGLLQNEAKKKLSKRDGDVNVESYAEKGYLPEALNNFVALLGWSHTRQDDVMAMKDLIDEFSLDRLTVGNTIVTFEKLAFLQKAHVRMALKLDVPPLSQLPPTEPSAVPSLSESAPTKSIPTASDLGSTIPDHPIIENVVAKLRSQHPGFSEAYIKRCISANLKNYLLPDQFVDTLQHFFVGSIAGTTYRADPPTKAAMSGVEAIQKYLKKIAEKGDSTPIQKIILPFVRQINKIPEGEWETTGVISDIFPHAPDKKVDPEAFQRHTIQMKFLRLALAGGVGGASIPDTLAALGKGRSLGRIREALEMFPVKKRVKLLDRILVNYVLVEDGEGKGEAGSIKKDIE
ncbi:hypothetical protein DFH27DRAFT_1915 [Peziza echinospora]|nr:hypothetical protein DFH27DRAFT_1915 [Peziza echinospora]